MEKLIRVRRYRARVQAVRAERDAVRLFAGVAAVGVADAADARFLGMVDAGLRIGAKALALLVA